MTETDTRGHHLSDYPREVGDAVLLGINGEGFAEYLRDDTVISARLDESGSVKFPAPEFGIGHELSLPEFGLDLPEYLVASAEENGEWRALSEFAAERFPEEE